MEREGEGRGREMKRRGRRGGEMRGIIIGGMVLSLLLGCNNRVAELENENKFLSSISNLGKGFLSIFTDLGDMVTDAFGIKAETKKEDIGKYFNKIAETMGSVKQKLQSEVAKNGNYEKVKTVVDKFVVDVLDRIASGATEAAKGATSGDAIGNAVKNVAAEAANVKSVNFIVKGIKEIVGVVLKDNGNPEANNTQDTINKTVGKLLSGTATDATEAEAAAASASIGSVSGFDILQAISKSGEASPKDINVAKDAAEVAVANKGSGTKTLDKANKDAVIAAGIALRAMAEGGKFAANTGDDKHAHAINGAAASAVNKTLSTLIITIRNTVDSGLKTINDALAAVKQEDKSASATNTAEATSVHKNKK